MTHLNDVVILLRTKREDLLNQLQAVDKALAALSGIGVAVTPAREQRSPGLAPASGAANQPRLVDRTRR
jgi:hypothetical protein